MEEANIPIDDNEIKKSVSKKKSHTERIRENPWILSTVVLAILVLVMLISSFNGITGGVVSEKEIGEQALNFFNTKLSSTEGTLESVSVEEGLYEVQISVGGTKYSFYFTKQGSYVYQGSSLISTEEEEESDSSSAEVPKSDKPVVELFVMSYCPYGTMAEKGIIPVVELLGDKIDFRIRYVDYLMHGEKEAEENLREYCIQEIAPEKYLDYMYCFLEGDGVVSSSGYITNGNDVDTCLAEAGINKAELESCITDTDEEYGITEALSSGATYPAFGIETDLNDEYGVSGSPGLVVNGVLISVSDEGYYEFNDEKIVYSRSPETYKEIICALFTDTPEECSTELSSTTPSVYFGWDGESPGSSENVCG